MIGSFGHVSLLSLHHHGRGRAAEQCASLTLVRDFSVPRILGEETCLLYSALKPPSLRCASRLRIGAG